MFDVRYLSRPSNLCLGRREAEKKQYLFPAPQRLSERIKQGGHFSQALKHLAGTQGRSVSKAENIKGF